MSQIPIALQLYSVRDDCSRDLPGVLEQAAQMGYDGVEFAGYHEYEAEELSRLLKANGLKVAGAHLRIDSLLGDELERAVEFNAVIENRYLIVPGLPDEYVGSVDAWKRTAGVFNEIAERLGPHGMFTGYHNHGFSGGEDVAALHVFFANTSEQVVLQADIGNALSGGVDIMSYVEKYPGRARTVHVKEYAADNDTVVVGEGDVDWRRVFDVCESVGGTEWYIVEQESYAFTPMECVRKCLENLRGMNRRIQP